MPNRFEDQPWYPEWKKTIDRVVTARMALDATTPGTPEWEAADRGEPPPIEKAHVHWPALGLENFLEACIYSRKIIANCQVPFSVRIGRLWQVRRGAVSQSLLQYLFGRNQQCAVEWVDDPGHEGAAVLTAKLAAYKAATVESRFS